VGAVALVRASKLAFERAIDPVLARHAYLAHARDRDLDQATTIADDFVRALKHNGGHDDETFDRELIEAVERLETALTPVTQPRDGREAG